MKEELQKRIDNVKDNSPESVDSIKNLMGKFEEINAKNNCMRVRFYDWFADYLDGMAKKMRDRAYKISTPCVISLPVTKPKKVKTKKDETTKLSEIEQNWRETPQGMKLPDEEVKKMVADLTPEIRNSVANVPNLTVEDIHDIKEQLAVLDKTKEKK